MIALLFQALKEVALAAGPLDGQRQAWFEAQRSELLERGVTLNPQNGRTGFSSWTRDAGTDAPEADPSRAKLAICSNACASTASRCGASSARRGCRSPTTWPSRRCAWARSSKRSRAALEPGTAQTRSLRSARTWPPWPEQKANLFDCLVSTFNHQPIQPDFAG
jgi:hypothetical protein